MPRRTTDRQFNRQSRGTTNQRTNSGVRAAVQKAGQRSLRGGTHPQQSFRGGTSGPRKKLTSPGAKLGPMGELGDDVIFEVGLREGVLEAYRLLGAPRSFNKTAFWRDLRNMVYIPFQIFMDKRIESWPPSDTDDLRKSLHNSITASGGSNIRSFPFQVVLNTRGIPYAGPVNKMPVSWTRHKGSHPPTKNSLGTGFLNDPNTKKGFYDLLLLNGRNIAVKLMKDFLQAQAAKLPSTFQLPGKKRNRFNLVKSLFQIKYK